MQELEATHNKRLRVFTDSEEAKLESEIEIITGQITSLFRKTERNLKRIFSAQLQKGTHDDTIRKNIQRSMAKQLQDYSFDFRRMQKAYIEKLKGKKLGSEGDGFGFGESNSSDSNNNSEGVDTGFNDMQLEMLRNYETDINQRDKEIAAFAKSIGELATIFKELSVLVIDQGTVLDRIDYNMEQVNDRVEKGVEELEKAVKYQKSSRPIWCIIILLIANGVMILLLYLKFKPQDQGNNANSDESGRLLRGF